MSAPATGNYEMRAGRTPGRHGTHTRTNRTIAMKATDDVFVLIKSLTKSEKRYFKLFAAKQGSEERSEYLQLFDLLDGMEEHDENTLREAIGEDKARYLPQMKYYLYRIILRALNQFHASSNFEAQINELLQAYDVLYDKRLYSQCRKILAKARKLAVRIDSSLHLTRVLLFEYHLAVLEPDTSRARDEIKSIFDDLVAASERSVTRYKYWRIQSQMFIAAKQTCDPMSEDRSWCDELMNDPIMLQGEPEGDPFAKLLYYFIYHHHAGSRGDHEGEYYWSRKIVALVEAEPTFRVRLTDRYIPAIYNLCMAIIETRRFDEFEREYRKLTAVAAKAREENPRFNDLNIRMLEPRMELGRGDFEKAAALIEPLEAPFRAASETLRIGFGVYFNYLFAYSYFGAGCHRRSLAWLGNILNDRHVNTHEGLHCSARILNLLLHYELGNHENLEFFLASAVRFLSRRNKLLTVEAIAIEMFKKLIVAPDPRTTRRVFAETLEKLQAEERSVMHRQAADLGADPFESLDLIAWIESKLTGATFAECARARVARLQEGKRLQEVETNRALCA